MRVLASAIVSVGDSNEMVTTAANRFFAKPIGEQTSTLTDLLTSTGRRAINLAAPRRALQCEGGRLFCPLPDPDPGTRSASKFNGRRLRRSSR